MDDNATEKGKKRSLIPQPPKPPLPPVPPRGVPPSLGVPPIPPYHWMHPSKSLFVPKPYNIPGIRRL